MSSTWNGSALLTRAAQKFGASDSTNLARVLEWMNEIQLDIFSDFKAPFLKFKLKKLIAIGEQEISIAPQIPTAPTIALLAGGSITVGAVYCKVTFVLFGEDGREFSSIESEPSVASNTVTTTSGVDQSLTLTAIDTYDGSTSVKPVTIHRRIYLKIGTGEYVLSKTIEDNTTVTTTITTPSVSVIEPPDYSLIDKMSDEDPIIEASGRNLVKESLDNILKYDPGLASTGTPSCYVRVSKEKILLYPRPSVAFTLSYWIYRKPSRIFADTDRVLQFSPEYKSVFDAGITWKGYEYRDSDGQETKLSNYGALKEKTRGAKANIGGQFGTVKRVC